MLDMSWGEVMVIGAVALIVIGPKDLPRALRTLGNMMAKVRRMAGEFQSQFNEAMREAELEDVKRQLQGMNESVGTLNQSFNPVQTVRDELKGAIEAPIGTGADAKRDGGEAASPPAEPQLVPPPAVDPGAAGAAVPQQPADASARPAAAADEKA
jgi:sec-independent protein translocase protein TatB